MPDVASLLGNRNVVLYMLYSHCFSEYSFLAQSIEMVLPQPSLNFSILCHTTDQRDRDCLDVLQNIKLICYICGIVLKKCINWKWLTHQGLNHTCVFQRVTDSVELQGSTTWRKCLKYLWSQLLWDTPFKVTSLHLPHSSCQLIVPRYWR